MEIRRSSTPFEVITDARVVTLIEFNASINSYVKFNTKDSSFYRIYDTYGDKIIATRKKAHIERLNLLVETCHSNFDRRV